MSKISYVECCKCGSRAYHLMTDFVAGWWFDNFNDRLCQECYSEYIAEKAKTYMELVKEPSKLDDKEMGEVETDSITKPTYYGKLDVLKFCLENNIPFCEGNIIKYVVRYTKKNGLEDLKKAKEYLDRLIKSLED